MTYEIIPISGETVCHPLYTPTRRGEIITAQLQLTWNPFKITQSHPFEKENHLTQLSMFFLGSKSEFPRGKTRR